LAAYREVQVPKEKLIAQARDELFSHINRCGVLQATGDDQSHWMSETIEYIGERYPDLSDGDLQGLHTVGMRFCQPTIDNVQRDVETVSIAEAETVAVAAEPVSVADAETVAVAEAEPPLEVASAAENSSGDGGGANAA
jgi:hypothetical protein